MFSAIFAAKKRKSHTANDIAKIVMKDLTTCAVLFAPLILLGSSFFQVAQPVAKNTPVEFTQTQTDLPWYDVKRFQYHIQTRLPTYREKFEQVAQQYGLPWTLLAAQAYQESRWDRHAKSPTGVRGLMMLTRDTASSLGIENRLDPHKSIEGGARYFAHLKNQVHENIIQRDRTWMALAAYNVGLGHIKDAQRLAERMDKNPYSWKDLKTVLPLLAKKQYYKTLQYGYACGWEPVQYVKRIRAYRALLEHYFREV